MKPVFWKLSMGPGTAGEDFKHVLEVIDWVRQGVVLVHKDTPAKGTVKTTQGEFFVEHANIGDYFYLCHGNEEPSVILLGQFTGPANLLSARKNGWVDRPFRWIKTAILPKPFAGDDKWWTPNHNSTFVSVPENELLQFESAILKPYFGLTLADFRL